MVVPDPAVFLRRQVLGARATRVVKPRPALARLSRRQKYLAGWGFQGGTRVGSMEKLVRGFGGVRVRLASEPAGCRRRLGLFSSEFRHRAALFTCAVLCPDVRSRRG